MSHGHRSKSLVNAKKTKNSSANRVLGILDLFTPEKPAWTVEMLQEELGQARATIYRYLRDLTDSGFLVAVSGGQYVLGPRFIEFDRQIRICDPLIQVAVPIMAEIRDIVAGGQLLCTFYGDRVMTVHRDQSDPNVVKHMSMERGKPFPLFRGSPSKTILANLSNYQLKNVYLLHEQAIREEGLGDSWSEFLANMKKIRRNKYWIASDIDTTLIGVSAPIFSSPNAISGALCLVRHKKDASEVDLAMLGELAVKAADRITEGLQQKCQSGDAGSFVPSARMIR